MRRKKWEEAAYVEEGGMAEGLVAPFPKREWCDPGDISIDQTYATENNRERNTSK